MATVGENVQSTVVPIPTSVPVRVAHELLLAGHRYLDVRYSLSLVFFFGVLSFRGFFFLNFFLCLCWFAGHQRNSVLVMLLELLMFLTCLDLDQVCQKKFQ